MTQRWAGLAGLLLLAAGAWLGLVAREEKDTVDDLALVPGSARLVVSFRPADVWEGELGKEARKALGKNIEPFFEDTHTYLKAGPGGIERVTMVMIEAAPGEKSAAIVRYKEKGKAKRALAMLVPGGEKQIIGGQEALVGRGTAGFVRGDRVLVVGSPAGIKAMLTSKEKRPSGLASALKLVAGGKHTLVGWIDGRLIPEKAASELPAALAMLRPLLAVKEATAWADIGTTTKASARLTFATEDDAKKAEKTLKALKSLASATLSGLGDEVKKGPKELAALVETGEKAVDDATLKLDGASLETSLNANISKAALQGPLKLLAERARRDATRKKVVNGLKQIGLGMHNYADAYGTFPPHAVYSKDGKALLSWRVLILPYVGEGDLYKKFKLDEPWDGPNNKKLIEKMPKIYVPVRGKASEKFGTFYQAFYGKGSIFEGKRGVKFSDIFDGTSNTFLVAEAGKDVVWTKPEDLPFDAKKKLPKLGPTDDDGFFVVFADGSVRFIRKTVKADTLKALITRSGGEVVSGF
jgi:hypothetical protein